MDADLRGLAKGRIGDAQVPWVGDPAGEGRGGGGLGAAEIDLIIGGPRATGKVPRDGAQADASGGRRLTHADAAVAPGLVEPGAGADEVGQIALFDECAEDLPGCRVDVERHAGRGLARLHHQRRHREVAQTGIGRGAQVRLVDRAPRDLAHGHHGPRARGRGDQRLEPGEIDLVLLVVLRVAIGQDFRERVPTALRLEEASDGRVGGKDRGGGAQLRPHVGDDVTVHRGQALQPGAVVLDDPADAPVHVAAAKHLQDYVLRAHPVRELAHQPDPEDPRHLQVEGLPRHCQGDLEPAGADGQHPEGPGRRSMAVGAEQRLAGDPEALHVDGMAHPVPCSRIPDAEPPARAAQEDMVVRIAEVRLDQVVVHVLRRQLGPHAVEVHGLELQHHEGPGGVLRKRLVDPDRDLTPRSQVAFDEVRFQELPRDAPSHGYRRPPA